MQCRPHTDFARSRCAAVVQTARHPAHARISDSLDRIARGAWFGLLLIAAGCSTAPGWQTPQISRTTFEQDVYPILIRDCAFETCHGADSRFFRVWGPGRVRLDPTLNEYSPHTQDEVDETYQRAISMIDPKDPKQSLLLRKPLAVEAGGAGHLGQDKFGRNVYRTTNDQGYLVLARWVFSVTKQ